MCAPHHIMEYNLGLDFKFLISVILMFICMKYESQVKAFKFKLTLTLYQLDGMLYLFKITNTSCVFNASFISKHFMIEFVYQR